MGAGKAEFETLRDSLGPHDEAVSGFGRAEIAGGFCKESEPAVEVPGVDRQRQMLLHGLTVIGAAHQRHRRPKGAHLPQMRLPILDPSGEDRAEQRIGANAGVESAHERVDHSLVDSRLGANGRDNLRTAIGRLDRSISRPGLRMGAQPASRDLICR